jgi:hypothetical protein
VTRELIATPWRNGPHHPSRAIRPSGCVFTRPHGPAARSESLP